MSCPVPSKERNLHHGSWILGPRSDPSSELEDVVRPSKVCRPAAQEGVGLL